MINHKCDVEDGKIVLYCVSYADSLKVKNIKYNPTVGLLSLIPTLHWADEHCESFGMYIQTNVDHRLGQAQLVYDDKLKQSLWNDELHDYFTGPDDPNMCILKIVCRESKIVVGRKGNVKYEYKS